MKDETRAWLNYAAENLDVIVLASVAANSKQTDMLAEMNAFHW